MGDPLTYPSEVTYIRIDVPLFTNVAVLIHVANEQHTIFSDQRRHARKLKYLIYQQTDRIIQKKNQLYP